MSLLIEGMEMPRYCVNCQFEYCGMCMVNGKDVEEFEYTHSKITKDPDCPLVPVPPHGDLIDRDALLKSDADYEYPLIDIDGSWDCVVPCYDRDTIKDAPTIIEAEEET